MLRRKYSTNVLLSTIASRLNQLCNPMNFRTHHQCIRYWSNHLKYKYAFLILWYFSFQIVPEIGKIECVILLQFHGSSHFSFCIRSEQFGLNTRFPHSWMNNKKIFFFYLLWIEPVENGNSWFLRLRLWVCEKNDVEEHYKVFVPIKRVV